MCDGYGTRDSNRITTLVRSLSDHDVTITSRLEVRPGEVVITLDQDRRRIDATWGICPPGSPGSPSVVSVAKGEKVNIDKTFAGAFESYRCLIPIDCWYQWTGELRDQKYRFQIGDGEPLLMAGILFPSREETAVIALSTRANTQIDRVHERMPVFIGIEEAHIWLTGAAKDASPLIGPLSDVEVRFERC